jgi:hypothetical protein
VLNQEAFTPILKQTLTISHLAEEAKLKHNAVIHTLTMRTGTADSPTKPNT